MANAIETTDWVLVAGLGDVDLPREVWIATEALGRALARRGFGLVTGGWKGVDHVAARCFHDEAQKGGRPIRDCLMQVVPKGRQPDFKLSGHLVMVEPGVHEWTESVRYGSAVLFAGGKEGTWETYQYALQEQRPVFALAGTGGMAKRVYDDVISRWSDMPFRGVTPTQYEDLLGRPIGDEGETDALAAGVVELIWAERVAARSPRDLIFISYSHKDRPWIPKVRAALEPLSKTRGLTIWDDGRIDLGATWHDEIQLALARTKVAILLVSESFLASEFIKRQELPRFIEDAKSRGVRIAWIPLDGASVEGTGLDRFQAAHPPSEPLGPLGERQGEAAVAAALVEVRSKLERSLRGEMAPES